MVLDAHIQAVCGGVRPACMWHTHGLEPPWLKSCQAFTQSTQVLPRRHQKQAVRLPNRHLLSTPTGQAQSGSQDRQQPHLAKMLQF